MLVQPLYDCNLACDFCCMPKQNSSRLDLNFLERVLTSIDFPIKEIIITGGEPSLLPNSYQTRLVEICSTHTNTRPIMYTNLTKIPFVGSDVDLYVSYDFGLRQCTNQVITNLYLLNHQFTLTTVLTDYIVEHVGVDRLIEFANKFNNLKRYQLVPFFKSQYVTNDRTPDYNKFEAFIFDLYQKDVDGKFSITPFTVKPRYEDFDDVIMITPTNKFQLSCVDFKTPCVDTIDALKHIYFENRRRDLCSSCGYNLNCYKMYKEKLWCKDVLYQKKVNEYLRDLFL